MEAILRHLGQRIRELRVQRGFRSQEEFADFCKVHRTFMGHLETGRKDFRLTTIIRVADALGVTLSELFNDLEGDGKAALKTKPPTANVRENVKLLRELIALERQIQRLKAHLTGDSREATPSTKPSRRGQR